MVVEDSRRSFMVVINGCHCQNWCNYSLMESGFDDSTQPRKIGFTLLWFWLGFQQSSKHQLGFMVFHRQFWQFCPECVAGASEFQFSLQAQHFRDLHRHFAWQVQHFRRVVLCVFANRIVRAAWSGDKWQRANSVAGVAFCDMCWPLTEASHETSILRSQI